MTESAQEVKENPILSQQNASTEVHPKQVEETKRQEVKSEEVKEDPNWKAFREARKKDRIEREAAEKKAAEKEAEVAALKAAMEAAFNKSSPQQQQAQQDPYGYVQEQETEDQKIEKKVAALLAKKEEEAERKRQEREAQEYPNRLNQTYSDFNQVITPENLDYLEYHYPEVANPLKRQADGFEKWSDIYRAIKRFLPNASTAKKETLKSEANFIKPKSMSSLGATQSTEGISTRLTEERKAANWERMKKAIHGLE